MSNVVGIVATEGDDWRLTLVSEGKHRKVVAFAVGKPSFITEIQRAAFAGGTTSVRAVREKLSRFW